MAENLVDNNQQDQGHNDGQEIQDINSFKDEFLKQKKAFVPRELSNRYVILTYNILMGVASLLAVLSSSAKFVGSSLRFSDFMYIFFNSLFHLSNLLRCLKQLFAREGFGFFYNNRLRGFAVLAMSFMVLPSFSTMDFGAVCGIVSIALSAAMTLMGFWVVDIKQIEVL